MPVQRTYLLIYNDSKLELDLYVIALYPLPHYLAKFTFTLLPKTPAQGVKATANLLLLVLAIAPNANPYPNPTNSTPNRLRHIM